MKTITGRVISSVPVPLSKAAEILSGFAAADNGASTAISSYIRRASVSFNELKQNHWEIEKLSKSERRRKKWKSESTVVGAEGSCQEHWSTDHGRKRHSKKHREENGGNFWNDESKTTFEDVEKPTRSELTAEAGEIMRNEKERENSDGKMGNFEEQGRQINGETRDQVGSEEKEEEVEK